MGLTDEEIITIIQWFENKEAGGWHMEQKEYVLWERLQAEMIKRGYYQPHEYADWKKQEGGAEQGTRLD